MTNLLDLPHVRARALLASGAPVYLPVNPVEYHGPHLSLHNDSLISRGIARDIHAGLGARGHDFPFLIASDLEVGVDPCPGPGSRATAYRDVARLTVEACQRLHELGAQRVVFVTFHGSPMHSLALDEGVRWLEAHGVRALSPLNLLLRGMLDLDVSQFADAYEAIADPSERALVLQEATRDFHAGFFETSLALHYAPASVDPLHRQLAPCPAVTPDPLLARASRTAARLGRVELSRELGFGAHGTGWYALRPFPGYTSRPSCASPEAGARFAAHIERWFSDLTHDVLFAGKEPPRPIMAWMRRATLHGALKGHSVPENAIAAYAAQALES